MSDGADTIDEVVAQWRRERPDLDTAWPAVTGRIARIASLVRRELERVAAKEGLSGADVGVLAALRRSGAPYRLPAGELSRSTLITTGGMTKRLDQLETRGLARREPDPRDRRGKLVALTDEGRAVVDRVVAAHYENEARLLADLPVAKREQLAELLRDVLLVLEQNDARRR